MIRRIPLRTMVAAWISVPHRQLRMPPDQMACFQDVVTRDRQKVREQCRDMFREHSPRLPLAAP